MSIIKANITVIKKWLKLVNLVTFINLQFITSYFMNLKCL